jgi:hypothetical protein
MTLSNLFAYLSDNPLWVLGYFMGLACVALLIGLIAKAKGHEAPYNYIYSGILYLVSIPGVLAIALMAYTFFFERRSIFDTNIITQILPVLGMLATMFIIKRSVNLSHIPGFNKLGNLVTIIAAGILLLWLLDKMHIVVFSYMPIHYLFLILLAVIAVIRIAWSSMSK